MEQPLVGKLGKRSHKSKGFCGNPCSIGFMVLLSILYFFYSCSKEVLCVLSIHFLVFPDMHIDGTMLFPGTASMATGDLETK